MNKVLKTEKEMIEFGEEIVRNLGDSKVIELIGDVGTGKTTITKGIAKALGVEDEITSPSFMISKKYATKDGFLVHYDFYRLQEPGIMSEDLIENINDERTITVIEWGDSVKDLIPENSKSFYIALNNDNTRTISVGD